MSIVVPHRTLVSILSSVALVGMLIACEDDVVNSGPPAARPVMSTVVGETTDVVRRVFPGTVRASQRVDLSFPISGELIQLSALAGQAVTKGDLLARIDPRDFGSTRDAAQAVYEQARAELERNQALFEKGFVAQARLDIFRSRRGVAKADLERTQKALDDTFLRAPFSGVVALRYVENFQDVQTREAILSLQDISVLEIVINLPEVLVARYRGRGLEFEITATFEAIPDQGFSLTVSELATQADSDTGTYQTVLAFEAPEGISVLPGMTGTVTAISKGGDTPAEGQIFVPSSAVFTESAASNVSLIWTIEPDTLEVARRTVQVGDLQGDQIRILAGVDPGERIVTAGVHYLTDGQVVRLTDSAARQ